MPTQQNSTKTALLRRALLLGTVAAVLVALLVGHYLSSLVRERMIRALQETYASDVQIKGLELRLFPWVHVDGEGLVLRLRGRSDLPPLLSVARLSVDASWVGLLRSPSRVGRVRLDGLQIHVPPRHSAGMIQKSESSKKNLLSFVIGEVDADCTMLETLTDKPGKDPLRFDISRLTLWGAGTPGQMSFRAALTNPKPVGEIHSVGEFGPWNRDEPSLTPVAGKYTFDHADLSTFRGISGIMSSQGDYQGVLEAIQVHGTTDTPAFSLDVSGNPVHLRTEFRAAVDGTDGDTKLEPVNAQFGRSYITASGTVEGKKGIVGKTVTLDVTVSDGRLEDMLRLGVKTSQPVMTGPISFHTKFLLPPGDQDVVEKLHLDGQFVTPAARFTKPAVQEKVNELSNRGLGDPQEGDQGRVSSNFRGNFVLRDGLITFKNLAFAVPGADVRLDGTYALRSQQIDLRGEARLQAKLSETTTGFKSFFLKAVDPFFKGKRAGAVIPIKITGTKGSPSFGLNMGGGKG